MVDINPDENSPNQFRFVLSPGSTPNSTGYLRVSLTKYTFKQRYWRTFYLPSSNYITPLKKSFNKQQVIH